MNYDLEMEKQMSSIEEGTPLLLHACCAPCSSAVLERIGNFFKITILYYNPNITNEEEYKKRVEEVKRFISSFKTKYPISLEEGNYDPREFFDISKGLEKEPERGKRCLKCYRMRLEETAKAALTYGSDFFTTTLSISPQKSSAVLNDTGKSVSEEYGVPYLFSDFKKKGGYKRSIELSAEYGLYRQNYCGCVFSKNQNKT